MAYKYPDAVLMIFCKAPIAGQVKTRLTTELSAGQAMQVHIELTQRTLQLATQSHLCPVQLWCTPSTDHPFFTESAQIYSVILRQQKGGNLGLRMNNAFCRALNSYSSALIIGCDCPSLTTHDLEAALTALNQENCCVLAPAEDGGYALVGLNQRHPELFDNMPWGTELVYEQTCLRLNQYNLHYHALKMQWDLDTPEDLARYRALTTG